MNELSLIGWQDNLKAFGTFVDARSPATLNTYKRAIKQFVKWLNHNGITNPGKQDIMKYREELEIRGLKPTTRSNYIIALHRYFVWLASEDRYKDIASGVKTPRLDSNYKKKYFSAEQIKTILDSVDRSSPMGARDYAVLMLMVTGGLRTIEVRRANAEDLSVRGNRDILFLQRKGSDEKSNFICVAPKTCLAIREYLVKAKVKVRNGDPLFVSFGKNTRGQRLTTDRISKIVKGRLRGAGFNDEKLTAHSFRHSAITLALLGDESLQEVRAFAGHKSINTTLIYSHNIERQESEVENTIERSIFMSAN